MILNDQAPDSTPLIEEDLEGLIPSYITLRSELNEAEHNNILEAESWVFSRRRNVLDEAFLRRLHVKMFAAVWQWAGQYRTRDTNIGVPHYQIRQDLQQLIGDTQYWVDHDSFEADEIAMRFHHRLVLIHPYPNGNGRHARLAADILLVSLNQERFTWGRRDLIDPGETRDRYIAALVAADRHDLALLRGFVRS